VVKIQLEIPLLTVTYAADLRAGYGARVVLNPAPAQPLSANCLAQVDVLIPNQSEAALLTGCASASDAARRLMASGVCSIIVTMGEGGVLIAEGETATHLPAHRVSVVDTTAAAMFVGAFAVTGRRPHGARAAAWAMLPRLPSPRWRSLRFKAG
jgi:ribokinase